MVTRPSRTRSRLLLSLSLLCLALTLTASATTPIVTAVRQSMPHKIPLLFIPLHPLFSPGCSKNIAAIRVYLAPNISAFTTKSSALTASRSFLYLTTSSGQNRRLWGFRRSRRGSAAAHQTRPCERRDSSICPRLR
jgi:hypothetical protein